MCLNNTQVLNGFCKLGQRCVKRFQVFQNSPSRPLHVSVNPIHGTMLSFVLQSLLSTIDMGVHSTGNTKCGRFRRKCFLFWEWAWKTPPQYVDSIIKNDVWLGDEVMMLGGGIIENGCVIGARSLLPPNFRSEPYGIYAGSPARLIRFRFSENVKNVAGTLHLYTNKKSVMMMMICIEKHLCDVWWCCDMWCDDNLTKIVR